MKVKAKSHIHDTSLMHGEYCGMSVCVDIVPEAIYNARKSGKYYFVIKKGMGCKYRLTEAAFYRLFEEVR